MRIQANLNYGEEINPKKKVYSINKFRLYFSQDVCNCTGTGYSGTVCSISLYPTSCAQVHKRARDIEIKATHIYLKLVFQT